MSLLPHHKKGLYFRLGKRVTLSSKKKLRAAQRGGSPLWHDNLNHWVCPLFCSDRPRERRGTQLTLFFPHLLLLVRCQMAMSWTHQGLFSFQLPWLSQPYCLKQTRSTGGPLSRKALMHCRYTRSHILRTSKLTRGSLSLCSIRALLRRTCPTVSGRAFLSASLSLHLLPVISAEHLFPVFSFSSSFHSSSHLAFCVTAQPYYHTLLTNYLWSRVHERCCNVKT